ncbi:copper-translocating P-type ATPase [Herbaspirillum sp. BH-1]|uniref:Cu2+-exporting ATPase n=1 Tax=Herbaspirillum frisingense TaxID=92645 RepID=A0ABU1PDA6_9BURK|nr:MULTISPECIES: heavy metal translocating P-type ATPase [Herbaspirillum]MDR6583902.1 Cu2+-exporting ATPase [Herbaspirillum frisingense]PLY58427.1 copper-translocating P-type ATPase [Herbaspirillum sp. BH-1]
MNGSDKGDGSGEGNPCFHCGQPVPAGETWPLQIGGHTRAMCCVGCQSVARLIVDSGCEDFYLRRTVPSARVDPEQLLPPELALVDLPLQAQHHDAPATDDQAAELVLSIDGLRCSACVWLIEKYLARLPGIRMAEMNVASARLHIRRDPALCSTSVILRGLRGLGYTAYPFDPLRQGEQARRASRRLFRQLFIAGLSMMQVMMYAVPVYMTHEGIDPDMMSLMRWASLFLTIPAVFYSALPFFTGAWAGLRARAPGMDLPVAIGIAAAFAGSAIATWRGEGEIWFDSVSMFIFLLLASRYLETAARRRSASALERMQQAFPASALVLGGYPQQRDTTLVAAAQLQPGDVILARPGDTIAADASLIEGETELDLALLSGESRPQSFQPGQEAPGGAVNLSQPVLLRVVRTTRDSTLAALTRLAEQAGQGKPALAQWADLVASRFVVALLLLAAATFLAWHLIDPSRAWATAIAVLVVSCPCALSLATPSALAAATDRLLREGTLVVRGNVLEALQRADTIVFDKTGTLTQGRPQLTAFWSEAPQSRMLAMAAAMERGSLHPLARALVQEAMAKQVRPVDVTMLESVTGAGMQCQIDGVIHRIGARRFVADIAGDVLPDALNQPVAAGAGAVYLGSSAGWLARFDLADALRPDAVATVAAFRRLGLRTILLSGDQPEVCADVAAATGITDVVAGCTPQGKLDYVRQLQQGGAVVAIVGDGINDAAMLRAGDVSFAMGKGAALAQISADAVIISDRLQAVADCAGMAQRTMRIVRQNLVWATLYNFLAIPAAAFGLLDPWMSAVGMSLSSLLVVGNALRLSRRARGSGRAVDEAASDIAAPAPALAGGV